MCIPVNVLYIYIYTPVNILCGPFFETEASHEDSHDENGFRRTFFFAYKDESLDARRFGINQEWVLESSAAIHIRVWVDMCRCTVYSLGDGHIDVRSINRDRFRVVILDRLNLTFIEFTGCWWSTKPEGFWSTVELSEPEKG